MITAKEPVPDFSRSICQQFGRRITGQPQKCFSSSKIRINSKMMFQIYFEIGLERMQRDLSFRDLKVDLSQYQNSLLCQSQSLLVFIVSFPFLLEVFFPKKPFQRAHVKTRTALPHCTPALHSHCTSALHPNTALANFYANLFYGIIQIENLILINNLSRKKNWNRNWCHFANPIWDGKF